MSKKLMGKITLTTEELENLSLDEFYELIGKKVYPVFDLSEVQYDCTFINIANNIQEKWFNYYSRQGNSMTSIAMLLVIGGPKVNNSLNDNEVEIFDGFVDFGKDAG
jgi:hypothetical protein